MTPHAAIWLVDGGIVGAAELDAFAGWLGAEEKQRHDRFVRAARRRQFLIGRGLLRLVAASLLGVRPRTISLAERPGQAPLLDAPLHVSLSHSGPWIACAASRETALGLDIELLDPARDVSALAEQAFDAAQHAWLASQPGQLRMRAFYQMWSEQEARIKLGAMCGTVVALEHAALSCVLCSAQPLAAPPLLIKAVFSSASGSVVLA